MKKVLVAEDETELASALAEMLTGEGYEVVTVKDGGECIAALKNNDIDLLLLDIMMPVADGFAVMKEIQESTEITKKPHVIILTNHDDAGSISNALAFKVSQYVVKMDNSLTAVVGMVRDALKE